MSDVAAVTFRNERGQLLFGTLHRPAHPRADLPAVVLMSPGVKMRVGPGRLYVRLTDLLTRRGHAVLRFDFHGLGDSEGDLPEAKLIEVYNQIERGRHAIDAAAALAWLREQGHRRFIVGGLCGGAITALYAAERDAAVEGLLSIGMTVTLAGDAVQPPSELSDAALKHRAKGYLRRLLNPRSWWRLITLQSEFGVIWRALLVSLRLRSPIAAPERAEAGVGKFANVNPRFPEAFFTFLGRGGRALMVFSEKDWLFAEYREKFQALHGKRLRKHEANVTEHLVPGANHVLSHAEWQSEMLAQAERWLEAAYGT